MKRTIGFNSLGLLTVLLVACGASRGVRFPTTSGPLALNRVVLYRNGIGYFERGGKVEGEVLTLRVRKDQINDLLKSLTVVDRASGKALSVSMPLDPKAWQNAAMSVLAPGQGSLAEMLDALRGTFVRVDTVRGGAQGRIVMVEQMRPEPDRDKKADYEDHKLSLLDGEELNVVRLSAVRAISIEDGDLVMQLHRRLDASAGEGMFQQVAIDIRLAGKEHHDLLVSYVVSAPVWKPTYRVVLSDDNSGKALLQGWAVVDNTSGENWDMVLLSLTSGAPIAFRYDLHTPQDIERPDFTQTGVARQARVAVGETGYGEEAAEEEVMAEPAKMAEERPKAEYDKKTVYDYEDDVLGEEMGRGAEVLRAREAPKRKQAAALRPAPAPPAVDIDALEASTAARATARRVSGLTRFDLQNRVTVPDGSATMVALINETVQGEQLFLFRPGGSGAGFEYNPYRVVRFKNSTDFVLEPGPISIYSGGSFVGEGLSQAVAANATATIPFAVEPRIIIRSREEYSDDEIKLVKIVRGVFEMETFRRYTTVWSVKGMKTDAGYRVLVRHPRKGGNYELFQPPPGTEQLPDAYLVPITVKPKTSEAQVEVVEQTPARSTVTIWDGRALKLLNMLLHMPKLDARSRAALQPIVQLRQQIGRIDTEIEALREQEQELDRRAKQTRENLKAIKKDPKATALRARLGKRLEQFTGEADAIGRRIVELNSRRLEHKIELEEKLRDLTITPE